MTGNDRDRNDGDVPRTVHDAMFKTMFSDPALAAQELCAVLPPALVACVDWSVLTLEPTSFVDAAFRQHISDLVFLGRFLEGGDMIFWLLEHQSAEDWWMLERVIETKGMMWASWRRQHPEARRLPVIVPVVIYNGPRPWRAPRDMHALYGLSQELGAALGPHVLSCTLIIDDLCAVEDEDLRSRRMDAYGRLCLFALARAARKDFLDRLSAWESVLCEVVDSGGAERIFPFVIYTDKVHRHTDRDTIRKRISAVLGPERENAMQFFYDIVVQEGYDKGLEKGRDEGREKELAGQRAMLLRLLGRRFGALPEPILTRVAAATQPEVERWGDRVLDAASLDDVFASE
jgi:predicted transposase YdaD